jgi:hypothetical protein
MKYSLHCSLRLQRILLVFTVTIALILSCCSEHAQISAKEAYAISWQEISVKYPDAYLIKLEAGSWSTESEIKEGKSVDWFFSYLSPDKKFLIDGYASVDGSQITRAYNYKNIDLQSSHSSLSDWKLDSTDAFHIAKRFALRNGKGGYICTNMALTAPPHSDPQWKVVFYPPEAGNGRIEVYIVAINAITAEVIQSKEQVFVS